MTAREVRDEARDIKRWLNNCYKAYSHDTEDAEHLPAIAEATVSLELITDMAAKWAKVRGILEASND